MFVIVPGIPTEVSLNSDLKISGTGEKKEDNTYHFSSVPKPSFTIVNSSENKEIVQPTTLRTQSSVSSQNSVSTQSISRTPIFKIVNPNLVEQNWTISRIAREAVPVGWEDLFQVALPELDQISGLVEAHEKLTSIVPLKRDIFRIFNEMTPDKIKVVIVGQDPYHNILDSGYPQAQGMSFSVPKGVTIPSSLRNIYKELATDIPGFQIPNHGDLSKWADQGVFLLNAGLTCKVNEAGSQVKIWKPFLARLIKKLNQIKPTLIYVLWGGESQKCTEMIERADVIKGVHPSGLSAFRKNADGSGGFFGGKYFSKVNELLIKKKRTPIDWQL